MKIKLKKREKKPKEKKELKKVKVCLNCGRKLKENQEFCPRCGVKYGEIKTIKCEKCGSDILPSEKFCAVCGTKVEVNNQVKLEYMKTFFTKKIAKKLLIFISVFLIVIIIFIVGKRIYQYANVSVEELIQRGEYEKAYEKASDEYKDIVIKTLMEKGKFKEAYDISGQEQISFINELAYDCNEIKEQLKDPSSFKLREIYYDKDQKDIVFEINGSNSYGGIVVNYLYYTYNTSENKFKLYESISSLKTEKSYSWDSYYEKYKKAKDNIVRLRIISMIAMDNNKLDNYIVDIINTLADNDMLKEVTFPDYVDNSNYNEENT